MTTHDIARMERVEMYLKAVFAIQQAAGLPTVSKVAEFMGVSVPSASEMLKRLEQQGLVGSNDEGVHLTAEGRQVAIRVVRRLRLAERLLTDVLKLDLDLVYDEACKMEHVISPEVEARLDVVLGAPTHCPHGQPIPRPDGAMEPLAHRTLADVAPDRSVEVASIPEEDPALVRYLSEVGLVPGARVHVVGVAPFRGPIFFEAGGARQAVGPDVAQRVRVAPKRNATRRRDREV
ncbi:MAG: metal-dependent transcriptional regulator [Armatimonadetes bacterium]|nr:metal-dependent transcriptional regulator [Armatimonadota bacterium]